MPCESNAPRATWSRRDVLAASVAAGAAIPGAAAIAQAAWPAKPIRVIVPAIPGSAPDVIARSVSEKLSVALGQLFVIENRAGAASNIGLEAIARTAPDGYDQVVRPRAAATPGEMP